MLGSLTLSQTRSGPAESRGASRQSGHSAAPSQRDPAHRRSDALGDAQLAQHLFRGQAICRRVVNMPNSSSVSCTERIQELLQLRLIHE
jgi:hypothetical protein